MNGGATSAATDRGATLHAGFSLLFVFIASWSWIGLVAAEFGIYRPAIVAVVSALAALGCAWRMRRSLHDRTWPLSRLSGSSLLGCLALAAALFFPAGEYAVDGGDASVYLNLGRAVSDRGALTFPEPVLQLVDPASWPDLLARDTAWPHLLNFFPGGIQLEPGVNRVLPNFFHLLPIWIANIETLAGPRGGYWVNVVFGVLSVGTLWMLGVRLSSLATGTIAALLLALSFGQIWFARLSSSEILTQYLLLTGLYFTVAHARNAASSSGVCAGAAFGLAALCRLDVLVLVSPLVAAYLAFGLRRAPGRPRVLFAVVFLALTLHAVLHALVWSRPYTERIAGHLLGGWVRPSSLAAPAVLLAAALVWWMVEQTSWKQALRPLAWILAAAAAAALGLRLAPRIVGGYPAMLMTAPAITAAVAGAILLIGRRPAAHAVLLVGVYAASALVYFESVRDLTAMPTLLRRYIPVILPLTFLLMAHACWRLSLVRSPMRWAGWTAPAVLAAVLAARSAPLLATPPMQAVAPQLAALAAAIPRDGVTLVDGSVPSHLGLSLHYTHGRDVLSIYRQPSTGAAIARVAGALRSTGRRLFVIVGAGAAWHAEYLAPEDFPGLELRPAMSAVLTYSQMESTTDRLPSRVHPVTAALDVYEVVTSGPTSLPLELDIGISDFPWKGEGFYGRELFGPTWARWTREVGRVSLPQLRAASGPLTLQLRLAAPRPAGVEAPRVQVEIDGRTVGRTAALDPEFRTYSLLLDASAANALLSGATMLTLRMPTFVPAAAGGDDHRRLGVAVDWIRISRP